MMNEKINDAAKAAMEEVVDGELKEVRALIDKRKISKKDIAIDAAIATIAGLGLWKAAELTVKGVRKIFKKKKTVTEDEYLTVEEDELEDVKDKEDKEEEIEK